MNLQNILTVLKHRTVQFSWTTILIIIGIILVVGSVLIWVFVYKKKPNDTSPALPIKTLVAIKDEVSSANMEATVKIVATNTKNEQVKTELVDISKEKDSVKRKARLLDLYKRVQAQ